MTYTDILWQAFYQPFQREMIAILGQMIWACLAEESGSSTLLETGSLPHTDLKSGRPRGRFSSWFIRLIDTAARTDPADMD